MAESIVWTALPHGVDASASNLLQLTVFVAPRLTSGENRSLNRDDAPDFSHWTKLAAAATRQFRVRFRANTPGAAAIDLGLFTALPQAFRPDLWPDLFANAEVRERQIEPIAERAQATSASSEVFATLQRHYQRAALATIDPTMPLPEDDRLAAELGPLRDALQRSDRSAVEWRSPRGHTYLILDQETALQNAAVQMAARRNPAYTETIDSAPVEVTSFLPLDDAAAPALAREPVLQAASLLAAHDLALLASDRLARNNHRDTSRLTSNEFHQILASLGNYPELLPMLGLSFELAVPLPLTTAPFTTGWLQVEPVWTPALAATPILTWTAIDLATNWPASSPDAPSKMSGGFLLSSATPTGKLDLVPVDLEGALLKIAGMSPADLAQRDRLPALRSAGLEIVRSGQGTVIHAAAARSLRNHARTRGGEIELYAEDLNRGYRVDARIGANGTWRSLHALARSFTPESGEPFALDVEGFVQLGVATLPGEKDGDPETLLVRDTLARWSGWSLSASRPGRAMGDSGLPENTGVPSNLQSLAIRQRVREGTLPRLRFGRRYQLRVRTVDLAGNSRPVSETTAPSAALLPGRNSSFLYRRFEPVGGPVLVPRQEFHEGESLNRIVLRSSNDLSPDAFVAAHPDYRFANERHVAPPKSTQFVAESHGRFDRSIGPTAEAKAEIAATYAIGLKEPGSLNDQNGESRFIEMSHGEERTGYTVHGGPRLALPYLPDPLARGAALRDLPGLADDQWGDAGQTGGLALKTFGFISGSVSRVAFGTDDTWPDFRPFRLRLAGGSQFAGPVWNAAEREFVITLPPAEEIEIGLRSFVEADDLDALGLWGLVEEGLVNLGDEQLSRIQIRAEAGDFWFITPEQRVTLTHAVQQPLRAPQLSISGVTRLAGQPFAAIENRIAIDARSTDRIDLGATWNETIDPVSAEPREISFQAHIRDQEIARPENAERYDSVNPTRKERWDRKDLLAMTTFGAVEGAASAGGDPVKPTGAPAAVDPADPRPPVRHEFGDTKHRVVRYQVVATTRFRDCFPPEIADDASKISRTGNEVEVIVPSSAQPAAPALVAALPAFRWQASDVPSISQTRQRQGGIRVYLDRPWYGSGADEKVGVVLWAPDPDSWPPDERSLGAVTRWGRDPIWNALAAGDHPFPVMPKQAHFPLRVSDPNGENRRYLLPGLETLGRRVAVAAHDMTFHQEGPHAGTASCDIQIDLDGAYTPFIRLALARFQPFSVEGCHLSPVLLTDFIQLAPNRTVTIASNPGDPNHVRLTVSGDAVGEALDPTGTSHLPRNRIDLALERRITGTTDDAGWEAATFPTAPQPDQLPSAFDGRLWQGTVSLPSPRLSGQFRLVIREYEHLATDDASGFQTGSRLVFADTVLLP